jgi:riboflavin biosynthesis pyrimidine reductase
MGLLRAAADAVLVGAGTVRASRTRAWTPGHVHPPSAGAYARWRQELSLAAAPTAVVVTATGDLNAREPTLARSDQPVIIATTDRGAARLRELARRDRLEIVVLAGDGCVPVGSVLDLLHDRGFSLVLSEAGPRLFGELLEAGAVDELFLTIAPRVVGRSEHSPRLGLVEGIGFAPAIAPLGRLRGVMRSADHLFLRYELATRNPEIGART